ncbi:auxin response factor 2 [Dorcoceras hygrometricum]|uniref:Auxin response factor 2 n=1 Tax=Dorcoceras hygrometricum TaxID=472368 RepID=A0A2Z7B2T2_9LAMI|nr:auxin response factor 2 [Dorcoceras hygrometricum]
MKISRTMAESPRRNGWNEISDGGGDVRDGRRRRRRGRKEKYKLKSFWDTASRGLTTFVTPKPHFRTNPSDHGKASSNIAHDPLDSIGYPRTMASGESSTTKHRLLHASGPHPTPPPDDPN